MPTIESAVMTIRAPGGEYEVDEAQLAAVSFLARYNGRTLEAGFASMFLTYWDRDRSPTTSQNVPLDRRPPTGVCRGRPVRRPIVSTTAHPGTTPASGRYKAMNAR